MDSKGGFLPDNAPPAHTRKGKLGWRVGLTVLLCASALFARRLHASYASSPAAAEHPKQGCSRSDPELVWNRVPSSSTNETLAWVPCYTGKQCARLMVPLDYSRPDGPQAGVALVKAPSKFPLGHKDYKGPILFNPGGPGGSGVDAIASLGDTFLKLLGNEYDIVGFDPRGIARTTPQVIVFPDRAEEATWRLREMSDPLPNTTDDAVSRIYSRAQVYGEIAKQSTSHASPYVSTALVARDMLSITRAHGFEKLQYWGFSYGTVLGATYAAMFPDNVGRLIIDGVVDSHDYYAGLWSNNLIDTDKGFHMIMQACVDAGPSVCPLHESTLEKVHARIENILNNLKRRPLPVNTNSSSPTGYGLVDYRIARSVLFVLLYSPYAAGKTFYPALQVFHALSEAEKGNGEPLGNYDVFRAPFKCECPKPEKPTRPSLISLDATFAILCSDGAVRNNDTVGDLEEHFDAMFRDTEFAGMWPYRAHCSGWKVRPVERFAGPFVGNTSHPLLIIGNTADPVTPLAHAHTMSKGFNGSVVLTQDSAGHCSLAAISLCTAKAIRAYFRNGKLPENGTVCEVQDDIFPARRSQNIEELSSEDEGIMNAWTELSDSFEVPRLGMPVA